MRVRYPLILSLTLALTLGIAATALATTFSYTATLSGANEVLPNASPATGTASIVYDDVAATLTATVTFSGLTAPATAAHIHGPGTTAQNAGVLFPFSAVPNATSGIIPMQSFAISSTQVGYLTGGLLYVNIHTSNFPGGEIRGQIYPATTPTASVTWGRLKFLYR